VRNAQPKDKPYRLADGEGLYLFVAPSGAKSWQFRYKLGEKQQTATLGKLSRVSLAQARKAADKSRAQADEGRHVTAESVSNARGEPRRLRTRSGLSPRFG
jgi:hypothetical protein